MEGYIGQIILWSGVQYVPLNWLECNGQTVLIQQYQALYSLIGTIYGGDAKTTFALPDLQARVPVGIGTAGIGTNPVVPLTVKLGEKGGSNTVTFANSLTAILNATLTAANIPALTANVSIPTVNADGNTNDPSNANLAKSASLGSDGVNIYNNGATSTHLNPFGITVGNSTPTPITAQVSIPTNQNTAVNRQPYLGLRYIICVNGLYPDRP